MQVPRNPQCDDRDFINVDNINTNLSNKCFQNNVIENSSFTDTNFTNTKLQNALITNTDFANTVWTLSNFDGTTIINSNFSNSDLIGADLSNSVIINSHFGAAKYDRTTLWPRNFDFRLATSQRPTTFKIIRSPGGVWKTFSAQREKDKEEKEKD